MKTLHIISFALLILFSGCNNPQKLKKIQTEQPTDSLKFQRINLPNPKKEVQYLIFGIYCGECFENCVSMYRLNTEEAPRYYNLYKSKERIMNNDKEPEPVKEIHKIKKAVELLQQVPDTLIHWKTDEMIFGCPDCLDTCGNYLEIGRKDGTVKKFYLDTYAETEKIPKEILNFSFLMNEIIQQLDE